MGSQSGMGAVAAIITIDCIPYQKLAFDMVFGISISGDSKISNIARALEEACDLRHTVKHLYNRLSILLTIQKSLRRRHLPNTIMILRKKQPSFCVSVVDVVDRMGVPSELKRESILTCMIDLHGNW